MVYLGLQGTRLLAGITVASGMGFVLFGGWIPAKQPRLCT